ncbi:MAG: cytochrome P460 family protein [Brasilonema octagenarum HA4186-MV1]|uniref:Cytochrome P460 n=2 Tax=Brasilonema TaxID=383614 RepID=A0A856MCW5_9CYAN|nr:MULTISPECIES: cytochrome P460 family protein [Brasilonema]MBW4628630.1 cytochrome P460 family protein [Brasilonema octagenarum HA4186-MV1]NMF63543.1 cytochrome P460 [Brasilonema octagenarum UFV-OR1]QDL06816.1 cytochrome P460 [Brasilonema sennae CENA114]QDL13182.1 cytochrome P460 [Brasilonema octagenarum UFV-E1]
MRRIALLLVTVVMVASVVACMVPPSQHADAQPPPSQHANAQLPPVLGDKIPPGYRYWPLISVAREKGDLNDIRAKLGNDVAIKAYREGKLPFPDGTIIARLAWNYVPSEVNDQAFGHFQSFVAGSPKEKEGVQFMVKDSRKYASTGGWGYAQFNDGKPGNVAVQNSCFSCHTFVKDRDFVFTNFAP